MQFIRNILMSFLRTLFHPVVLISLLGPLILSTNLMALRDALNFPYGSVEVTGSFLELKKVLNDIWSYALIDFNIQLYTSMLAWIVFYVEVVGLSISLLKRYHFTCITTQIKKSTLSLLLSIGIVALFFGGVLFLMSGSLSSPEVVKLYLPDGLHISGGIRFPSLESSITWFRGVILLFGVLLSIWEQYVMPKVFAGSE